MTQRVDGRGHPRVPRSPDAPAHLGVGSKDGHSRILLDLFKVGVGAADPEICVPPLLPAPPKGRTVLVAAGKAAASMTRAVTRRWQGPLSGIAVTRYGHGVDCGPVEVVEAGHPVPDASGESAARRLLAAVGGLTSDDLVICLISGGGSALLTVPAEGVTLAAKQSINRQLLASGARISEINTVRKHLSAIKGGRLAEAAFPARIVTIGISDVPGDDPSVIASGPTVADATTCQDAIEVLRRYGIEMPAAVRSHLDKPGSETPKPNSEVFRHTRFHMAVRPSDMVEAVVAEGRRRGFDVVSLGANVEGEARTVGAEHARLAIETARRQRGQPTLIVSGGETTVTVRNPGGRGGRNLEYLLSFALEIEGKAGIQALACDTDGIDGSENNAGAFLDRGALARARAAGVDPADALARNDAYAVFDAAGNLIVTGPTLTNVNDLRLILID